MRWKHRTKKTPKKFCRFNLKYVSKMENPQRWLNVLSLFDWIACWYEALIRAWIKIEKYLASEIDEPAIQIAMKNHPDIIQIWDVKNVKGGGNLWNIDLLMWWSPCQWFSRAWKMLNFDDPRSKLFFEFVRIKEEIKPKYFLLENVKMKKEFQDIISQYLWVEPIEINSSLVSGQNRKRLYWTNIEWIKQPENKNILLKDILETDPGSKYFVEDSPIVQVVEWKCVVRQATKKWFIVADDWDWICLSFPNSKTRRWRVIKQKSSTLMTSNSSCVFINWNIRRLTPVECERLQNLPDNYTAWISETQRFKTLWNGWTVDVLSHIFKNIQF